MKTLFFWVLSLSATAQTVFVDGIYDLAHYGHQKSFSKARKIAAEHFNVPEQDIRLIVGVCGGDIKSYKRETVLTLEQRVAQISSFKGVDQVIPDTPLVFDDSYIEEYKIDLVMHGDDYTQEKIEKYYPGPLKRGIFKTFPYEPGISTTQILKTATERTLETMLEKNSYSCEETENMRKVINLLKQSKI